MSSFAIIDELHVIMPILAHNLTQDQHDRQDRYGAVIIEDRARELVLYLQRIIKLIDDRSRPLHVDDFEVDLRDTGVDADV